jgi:hypothetical protein
VAPNTEQRVSRLNVLREVYQRARRYDEMVQTAKNLVADLRKLITEVEPQRQGLVENLLFEQQRMLGVMMAQAKRYDDAVAYLRQMIEPFDGILHFVASCHAVVVFPQDPIYGLAGFIEGVKGNDPHDRQDGDEDQFHEVVERFLASQELVQYVHVPDAADHEEG